MSVKLEGKMKWHIEDQEAGSLEELLDEADGIIDTGFPYVPDSLKLRIVEFKRRCNNWKSANKTESEQSQ